MDLLQPHPVVLLVTLLVLVHVDLHILLLKRKEWREVQTGHLDRVFEHNSLLLVKTLVKLFEI